MRAVLGLTSRGGRVARRRRRRWSNEGGRPLLTRLCAAGLRAALLRTSSLCAVRLRGIRRWACRFLLPLPLPQLCQHPKC